MSRSIGTRDSLEDEIVNLSRNLFALTAAALSVFAVGCSETTLVVNPGSAPPTRVNAVIEVETDHPVDAHTLDFGEVYAGETREKEVTITNMVYNLTRGGYWAYVRKWVCIDASTS